MQRDKSWADVAQLLRAQRRVANLSLRSLAALTSVSDSYLSQVERGLYQPSPDVLKAIADALGMSARQLYENLGWIEAGDDSSEATHAPHPPSVESAIASDERLVEHQKAALLQMYRALVEGNDSG